MDGNVSAGRGDDEVAVCSDATHLLRQIQWGAAGAASASRHTRTVPSSAPLTMTGVLSGSSPTATAFTEPAAGRAGKAGALVARAVVRESVTVAGRAERARLPGRSRPGCSARGIRAGRTPRCWGAVREQRPVQRLGRCGETVTVAVRAAGGVVRVDVTDRGGRGVPQLRASGDEAERGRGLGWSGLGRTTCRRKTARSASQPNTRTINR